MKPSSAAPTLTKERVDRLPLNAQKALYDITDIANWLDDENQPESATLIEARDILIAVLEVPPAAERTALKDAIQTMIEVGIWIEVELREQKIKPAKSEVFQKALKVKDFLESLDAASASEGTNTP